MTRDIEPPDREALYRDIDAARAPESDPSREPKPVQERGYVYQVSPAELAVMKDIGRFRTIDIRDLAQHRYGGRFDDMRRDLSSLKDQGLIRWRTFGPDKDGKKLPVVVLTKQGEGVARQGERGAPGQQVYSGFVKEREVQHDAAIYRMFQAEAARIEQRGGRIRRVILDYELKQKVYSPLAKAKALPKAEYARRQAEVARANHLRVIEGKIPLPDLRIEYEASGGEIAHVDLELATEHYRPSQMQGKAAAGFTFYSADGSAAHLSRVLEEREITAAIFSL